MKCNWMRNPRPAYCCHCCHIFLLSVYSVVWLSRLRLVQGLRAYRYRQAGEGTPLSSVRLPIARRRTHIMCCCIVCWSFLEQKAKNTIPSIQYIYMYLYISLHYVESLFLSAFVLRPYIYSALIRFIITFHFYSSSSSFLLIVIVILFLFSLCSSYEFMDSNVLCALLSLFSFIFCDP